MHQKKQKVVENKGEEIREWCVRCRRRQGSGVVLTVRDGSGAGIG